MTQCLSQPIMPPRPVQDEIDAGHLIVARKQSELILQSVASREVTDVVKKSAFLDPTFTTPIRATLSPWPANRLH